LQLFHKPKPRPLTSYSRIEPDLSVDGQGSVRKVPQRCSVKWQENASSKI